MWKQTIHVRVLVALLLAMLCSLAQAATGECRSAGGLPGLNARSGLAASLGGLGSPSRLQGLLTDLALGAPAQAMPSCGAQASSTPGEPASLAQAQPALAAGNPVDVVTGAKHQRVIDVALPAPDALTMLAADGRADAARVIAAPLPGDPLVLTWARHYQSTQSYSLAFGPGWSHSFETRLARQLIRAPHARADSGVAVRLQILQGDGRRILFDAVGVPDPKRRALRFLSSDAQDGLIEERDGSAGRSWIWYWPEGRRLEFDTRGRLAAIEAPDQDRLELRYRADGRLESVADRHDRRLTLEYQDGRLSSLSLPDGGRIRYLYDDARRLKGVRYPDGRLVRYHYEDPRAQHWLTGLTEADGRRATYRYDDLGRVLESRAAGTPEAEALRFDYAGSASAGYTELRWRDSVTRYHRASFGGVPMLERAEGPGCPVCPPAGLEYRRDASGRLTAQGRWQMRYDRDGRLIAIEGGDPARPHRWVIQYAGDGPLARASVIESPSVVPGRTRRLELAYNERGQLLLWRETGYSPDAAGIRPISREYRYAYQADGPSAGKLVAIEHGAGRALAVQLDWSERRTLEALRYPLGIEHRIRRDALARPMVESLPDGTRIEREFDPGWRLAALRTADRDIRLGWNLRGLIESVAFADGERWALDYGPQQLKLTTASGRRHQWSINQDGARIAHQPAPEPVRAYARGLSIQDRSLKVIDADGGSTEFIRDDFGRTVLERSAQTGERRLVYDESGRLSLIDQAGVRQTRLLYDSAGRLTERKVRAGSEVELTRLVWRGMRLVAVEHPAETLRLTHDTMGRLLAMERIDAVGHRLRIEFKRDSLGRVIERGLGDGLAVRYEYDRFGRIARMGLLHSGHNEPEWLMERHFAPDAALIDERALGGRLVRTETASPSGALADLVWRWRNRAEPLEHWRFRWRADGQLAALADRYGEDRFGYDRLNRLVVRERKGDPAEYYFYSAAGDLLASRDFEGKTRGHVQPPSDSLGRPRHWGPWTLSYGASGRIEMLSKTSSNGSSEVISRYRYNALGERVSKSVTRGESMLASTGFMYFGQRLAAELDDQGRIARHYLYWQGRPIAVLDMDPRRPGRVRALHHLLTDHLGTPHRAIDRSGRVVWAARYDSYGAVRNVRGNFRQPLRLPGQYHDEETGLHDNYLRTYDPAQARYLEPDPLGLAAGLNRFAYVEGRPHVASDPLGLILFAFDGTANGRTGALDTRSNVARLFSLYEGDDGHYMSGVGVDDPATGIRATLFDRFDASSARARVDTMLAALDRELRSPDTAGETVQVDVIGFSRGAAMARDFANTVAARIRSGQYAALQRCVSLNFVGLWDTVAQFGLNGIANDRWNLGIPDEARVVVHAVAANEHRRLFPLESILPTPPTPPTGGEGTHSSRVSPPSPASAQRRIERAFIGDHADIGGSHTEGDLADVTLSWMYRHAREAGVELTAIDPKWEIVVNPLVHDGRSLVQLGPDREVRYASSASVTQKRMSGAGLQWQQAVDMMRAYPSPRTDVDIPIVGEVDIAAYAAWLDEHYGLRIGY